MNLIISEIQNSDQCTQIFGLANINLRNYINCLAALDSNKTKYFVPFVRHLLEIVISGNIESRFCFELWIYTQNGIVMKTGFVSKTRQ